MSTQPDPKDTSLDELEYFAKAWMKYISVATLAGDSAPTLSGTKSAIRGYDNVAEDFTKSLQSLLSQQRAKLFEQIRSEAKSYTIEVMQSDGYEVTERAVPLEALTRLEKEHE